MDGGDSYLAIIYYQPLPLVVDNFLLHVWHLGDDGRLLMLSMHDEGIGPLCICVL